MTIVTRTVTLAQALRAVARIVMTPGPLPMGAWLTDAYRVPDLLDAGICYVFEECMLDFCDSLSAAMAPHLPGTFLGGSAAWANKGKLPKARFMDRAWFCLLLAEELETDRRRDNPSYELKVSASMAVHLDAVCKL